MAITLPPKEQVMKVDVQQKINFYNFLAAIVGNEAGFDDTSAPQVVRLYEKIKSSLTIQRSIGDVTIEVLRKANHHYRHGAYGERDLLWPISEAAFRDLAKHMRIPEAQRVFVSVRDATKTTTNSHLYCHISNVRRLSGDPNGMAVVTLVVDSYSGLQGALGFSKVFTPHISH